jgi:hypothetical protein
MAISQKTSNAVFWKFIVPCRIISIFFAVAALFTFFVSLLSPIGKQTFIYISYIVMYVILTGGFWRMRKWVVTLMGCTMVYAVVYNIARLFQDTQKINFVLLSILFTGAIFLFSYISRSQLEGEYKDKGVLSVFIAFLLLSQLLLIF